MKRNIIEIDESLCNGCGQCVDACAEGAIALIGGVARVVREQYCDGLGACVGDCPTGALQVVQREAPAFDFKATESHVRALRGAAGVHRMREEHAAHGAIPHAVHHDGGGCPGSRVQTRQTTPSRPAPVADGGTLPPVIQPSGLDHWPVQLHLVPPRAPFFEGRELVVLATCGPVASADVHWRFLKGRAVVVACPKLDRTEPYLGKLAAIFAQNHIPRVLVVRMEVPCCGGLTQTVMQARQVSGRDDLPIDEVVIGVDGAIRQQQALAGRPVF